MYQSKNIKMTTHAKSLVFLTACILAVTPLTAQDDGFDLSSQRSESQDVNPVSGMKLDHKGLVVNPVPQEMILSQNDLLDVSAGFKLKDRKGVFVDDVDFLSEGKLRLDIDFGGKAAEKHGVKRTSGAYVLTICRRILRKAGSI